MSVAKNNCFAVINRTRFPFTVMVVNKHFAARRMQMQRAGYVLSSACNIENLGMDLWFVQTIDRGGPGDKATFQRVIGLHL